MRRRVGLGVIANNWERNQLVTSPHFVPRSRLEIALLSFLCNVAGGADRERHDSQGRIILRECRKQLPSTTNRFFTSCAFGGPAYPHWNVVGRFMNLIFGMPPGSIVPHF
jgi:hypothetical protein